MSSYLKTEPSASLFSFQSYDIYNPFDSRSPKPFLYSNYQSSPDISYLYRNLRAETSDFIEMIRRQEQLIKKKELQHYDIIYGEKNRNSFNNMSDSSPNLNFFSQMHGIHSKYNPFTAGESQALKQLKTRHTDAKVQFSFQAQHIQEQRIAQFNERQQNQQNIKSILQKKQFKSIMELKNLEDYRRIKQAQKLKKQQQKMGLLSSRKSLLNINSNMQRGQQSLFSFGLEQAKQQGLKLDSKFVNSRIHENDNEHVDDLRITFSADNEVKGSGFRMAKRPPKVKKPNEGRDSLNSVTNSLDLSPRTIKLKNKTFYLISS